MKSVRDLHDWQLPLDMKFTFKGKRCYPARIITKILGINRSKLSDLSFHKLVEEEDYKILSSQK